MSSDSSAQQQAKPMDATPTVRQVFQVHNTADFKDKLVWLMNDAEFSDITLIIRQGSTVHRIHAHRCVLAVWSPVFRTMFTSGMKESREKEVPLDGVDYEDFHSFLSFMYYGDVILDYQNVWNMLDMSNMYDVPLLKEKCCAFLGSHLELATCYNVYEYAGMHECKELESKALEFIISNFKDFFKTPQFLEISVDLLKVILVHDSLAIADEVSALVAIKKWVTEVPPEQETPVASTPEKSLNRSESFLKRKVEADQSSSSSGQNRLKYLPELFELVRVPLFDEDQLDRLENDELLCKQCPDLLRVLLLEAWKHLKNPSKFQPIRAKKRRTGGFMFVQPPTSPFSFSPPPASPFNFGANNNNNVINNNPAAIFDNPPPVFPPPPPPPSSSPPPPPPPPPSGIRHL
eukprot:TRINITY_DN13456_c0_g1_i2.p1 TRINITY_DN13456_c0_g1~~TRINITY_DN13456_c0_g1_i2.p1  ORF type:complete len:433 (-),score=102.55 TRINITY_DN13456_c0_g1_i2:92-1303(-)